MLLFMSLSTTSAATLEGHRDISLQEGGWARQEGGRSECSFGVGLRVVIMGWAWQMEGARDAGTQGGGDNQPED